MKTNLNTLVFRGEFNEKTNPLSTPHCGLKSSAWYRGDAISDKDKLEGFVRELASGDIQFPAEAAEALMEQMNFA